MEEGKGLEKNIKNFLGYVIVHIVKKIGALMQLSR